MLKLNLKRFRPFSILNVSQVLVLLAVAATMIIVLDLSRREQAGRQVGVNEESLAIQVTEMWHRQVELKATLSYVQSDDYVADFARNEAGYILPGERRVVPLVIPSAPGPEPVPIGTPDPAHDARPWQAWLRLLTDAPAPTR